MRRRLAAEGRAFRLRPVRLSDAGFIVALRTDPVLGRHIHAGARDATAQRAWLRARSVLPGDHYFVVERRSTGAAEGLISLYGVRGDEAEFGRWVLGRGSLAAPESVLLVFRIAFDVLGLGRVFSRTLAANTPVVSMHDRYGAARTGRPVGFDLDGVEAPAVEHEVTRAMWPEVQATLGRFADQAASLLER